jgi:hypothetical protein
VNPTSLRHRIYADFLMPSRLGAYRGLLELALGAGYRIVSIETFWQLIRGDAVDPGGRYLVLRHDVDTDSATARAMWDIERGLGIESSYYFRLSTTDLGLMRAIAEGGSQASYHFEELATIAKQRHLRDAPDVQDHLPEARALFQENLARLRASTGLPMGVVASHGDFVNRAVRVANRAILDDPDFRRTVGVELEVYDEAYIRHLTSRYSDTHHPRYWVSDDPHAGIARGEAVIQVLVHPRHWRVHRLVNAVDDIRRVAEGLAYRLPSRPADPTRRRPHPRPGTPPGHDPDVPAR